MKICIVCQPDAEKTHWCGLYLKGIHNEAKRKGDKVVILKIDEVVSEFENDKPACAGVLSTSRAWTEEVSNLLAAMGVQPIIIGGASRENYRHASYVYMDYKEATYSLVEYLHSYNKKRIALFAISTDSAPDMIKRDAFLSCDLCREYDVFYYSGTEGLMNSACKRFINICKNYDAVICSNDASAVILMHQLEEAEVKVPEDIFLCAFGDMTISSSGKDSITLARLNCTEIGKQTVLMCHHLAKCENLSSVSTKVRCDISVGDSTASLPLPEKNFSLPYAPYDSTSRFHNDPSVSRIFLAEKILSACDAIDIDLLKLIINGYKYFDIADILHVSESTIKYRLKRLISLSELQSRDEVIEIMKAFLN